MIDLNQKSMEKDAKKVKLPFLIHRNNDAIESEIFKIREEREAVGKQIKTLTKCLCEWKGEAVTLEWVLGFVDSEEYELDLLEDFQRKNSVPFTVRIEKIKDVYKVPDFDHIIKLAQSLKTLEKEYLFSFIKGEDVSIPEITREEKNAIIEHNSIYITTEQTFLLYQAITSLCEFANIMNFDIKGGGSGANKITKATLSQCIPLQYVKFIDWEQPSEGTQKRKFTPKYESFKNS